MEKSGINLYFFDMNAAAPSRLSVRVNRGGIFLCRPDWSMDLGPLPDMDLWAVFDGRGRVEPVGGGVPVEVAAGDVLLLRRGGRYRGRHDPRHPLTVIAVHFDWLGPRGKPVSPEPLPRLHRRVAGLPFFRELMTRTVEAWRNGDGPAAAAWFQAVLLELRREDARRPAAGPGDEWRRRIRQLADEILRDPAGAAPVGEMAATLGITPDHFARLFRRHMGATPGRFVLRARLETARGLLLDSTYSIGRVAELAGYRSLPYFSRQFQDASGMSPRAFRRKKDAGATVSARE